MARASRASFLTIGLLSLSLCVGANIVVFTLVKALWLQPQSIPDPDRVVMVPVGTLATAGQSEGGWWAEGGLKQLRQVPVFSAVAGQVATSGENAIWRPRVTIDKTGRDVETVGVTSDYFAVMGLTLRGRDFMSADDRHGAPLTGVISNHLWRTVFDASPSVIGADVAASPMTVHVIGVAPPDFHGARLGENVDLWIPRGVMSQVTQHRRPIAANHEPPLLAFARLRPGPSLADAMRVMANGTDPSTPAVAMSAQLIPISRIYGTPDVRTAQVEQTTMLWLAAAAAAIVLIGGCATLMAAIFVHYERRRHELAIRMSLGCSRGRLLRALTVELASLGFIGTCGAFAVAMAGFRIVPSLRLPGGIDVGRFDLSPDWRVVAFGAAASFLTLAVGAFAPLRRATRPNLLTELNRSSSKSTSSSLRLRRDIVALQVAVTVVALVATGPFARAIVAGLSYRPLFDAEHTLFIEARTNWPFESKAERAARQNAEPARITQLLDALRELPGVSAVALGGAPIGPDQAAAIASSREHQFPRVVVDSRMRYVSTFFADVGPSYFDALQMRLVAGRLSTTADATSSLELPVVVTQSFADALWPAGTAVGRTFGWLKADKECRVVGVVSDIAFGSSASSEQRGVFRALDPIGVALNLRPVSIVLRTSDPARLSDVVRRLVASALPMSFETSVVTGAEIVAQDYGRAQLGAWFFGGFGIVALMLGLGGVFGLVAYVTESRRREMGIRLALGGRPTQLARSIVVSGAAPVIAGTAAGIGVSAVLGQVISTTFLDVSHISFTTYPVIAAGMVGAAAAAAIMAAWRVRHVSPNEVLRAD